MGHDHFVPRFAEQPTPQGERMPVCSALRLRGMPPNTSCGALAVVLNCCSSRTARASSSTQYQLL
jgi:hypothetical protein